MNALPVFIGLYFVFDRSDAGHTQKKKKKTCSC